MAAEHVADLNDDDLIDLFRDAYARIYVHDSSGLADGWALDLGAGELVRRGFALDAVRRDLKGSRVEDTGDQETA